MIWQTSLIKTAILWWYNNPTRWLSEWDIVFWWFNLLDCWEIYAEDGNYDDINKFDISTYNAPRIDWWWLLWYYINWKQIDFRIILRADNETDLNNKIDEMKKKLAKPNQDLKIKINWEYRVWEASLNKFEVNRDFSEGTIQSNIQIWFIANTHWESNNSSITTYNNVTTNINMDIENNWTTSCDYIITIVFSPGSSWVDNIIIEKDWYELEINQSVSPWDVIVINWIEKEVLYMMTEIDYDWVFRQLEVGSNPIILKLNWSPVCTVSVVFNENYL